MIKITEPPLLPNSEFSGEFISMMMNRMLVSFHKYGEIAIAYPLKLDAIESLKMRLDKYLETGNREWLVDAANFAMIEFMHPKHEKAHFRGTDSHESPGRITTTGMRTKKVNEDLN